MSKILVIIPHFNKLSLLKECIYHLECQSFKAFDIMVVDNGSDDGSSEYLFEISNKNSSIHYTLLNENMGFAYAVNKGLEYSIKNNYDYSILLNNDAFVTEDFVNKLYFSMLNSNKIFAVSSLMLRFDDKDKIDSFGDYYTLFGWSFQGHLGEDYNNIETDEEPFSACGGASIYSNDIIREIGGFDEKFFAYLEDIDISYRARLSGYKILTCKAAKCYHLGSSTTGSKYNEFKVRISARNNIYLIFKNMPLIQILINIFPLFLGHLIKLIYFSFNGFGLDYFFGIVDGLRSLNLIKKAEFDKTKIFNYILIELELIKNTIMYAINFVKRHI